MAETWNLDRMEQLLEDMEPAEIRSRYAAELAAHPQCLAMLEAFEGLDEGFSRLKEMVPATPRLREPAPVEALVLGQPQTPRAPRPIKHWSRWAMPLAAMLLLGILLTTRTAQKVLSEAAQPRQAPLRTAETAEPPDQILSVDKQVPEPAQSMPPATEPTAADTLEAGPREAMKADPAPERPSLRKSAKKEAYEEQRQNELKTAKPRPLSPAQEQPQPQREADASAETLGQAMRDEPAQAEAELMAAAAPAPPPREAGGIPLLERAQDQDAQRDDTGSSASQASSQPNAPAKGRAAKTADDVSEETSTKLPRGRRVSSIMELAPGATQVELAPTDWLNSYNNARQDATARTSLFASIPPFAASADGLEPWPELRLVSSEKQELQVETLDAQGAVIARYLLKLDKQCKICVKVTRK